VFHGVHRILSLALIPGVVFESIGMLNAIPPSTSSRSTFFVARFGVLESRP
jgi:hypothetical protein